MNVGGAPVPGELRHVADVVQEWGAPRGWRVARDVHKRVLEQFPGQPFHEFRRKRVPVVATGSVDGAPAALVQVDFVYRSFGGGGSFYSTTSDTRMSAGGRKKAATRAVLIVELPGSIPDVAVTWKTKLVDEFLHATRLNRCMRFQSRSLGTGSAGADLIYHVSGSAADLVRSIVTAERVEWLYGDARGPLTEVALGDIRFRLSGRRLMVWGVRNFRDPMVIDGLVRVAREIRGWIPPEAFQSAAADSGLRVSDLQLPVP